MPREKWKISMSLGKNQLILMRNRCETAIGAVEAMQRRAKIHSNTCLKKRKDVSADLKSEHAKKGQ